MIQETKSGHALLAAAAALRAGHRRILGRGGAVVLEKARSESLNALNRWIQLGS